MCRNLINILEGGRKDEKELYVNGDENLQLRHGSLARALCLNKSEVYIHSIQNPNP